jgi:hypothetical protein
MNLEEANKYYTDRKPKMMKNFDKASKKIRTVLNNHFDETKTNDLVSRARNEYESIIPKLSYIGGKGNIHNFSYIGGAWNLAFIKSLEKEDLNEHEIGKIIYEIFKEYIGSMSGFMKWLFKKSFFSKSAQKKWMNHAEKSQSRTYKDDWVFEYVEGDGKTFDFGINYTECAICKLYKKLGAERYLPYVCLSDYPMFRIIGVGLKRTKTIGNGADLCDFRVKRDGITLDIWPPDNLTEFKKKT